MHPSFYDPKMSIKNLFWGVLGLASVWNQATAQLYDNHHQKFYNLFFDPSIFDTKALTPVEKLDEVKWAFASTVSNDTDDTLNVLLTKLGTNTPNDAPFPFEWAKEYSVRRSGKWSIDVFDVVYEPEGKKPGYILCGRVINLDKKRSDGFLLRVKEDGTFKKGRTYSDVSVFTSCVPWHNRKGYVAVGQTKIINSDVEKPDAVYISVKKNLKSNLCGWRTKGLGPTESRFNKVIRYKKGKKKLYAVVGETTQQPNDKCASNSDVLVFVGDDKCTEDKIREIQYGDQSNLNGFRTNERGLSIAQFSSKEGGLVITGNTKRDKDCAKIAFDDVLTFKLDDDLTLDWMGHYDIALEDTGSAPPDIGTAVQMDTDPDRGRFSVLVAGQAETDYFGTGPPLPNADTFVLDLDQVTGDVNTIDVLGLGNARGLENGALFPGNLDLHLSPEGHAVVMGNAKFPFDNDRRGLQSSDPSFPYLAERYVEIQSQCKSRRYFNKRREYDFPNVKPNTVAYVTSSENLKIDLVKRILGEDTECRKRFPPTLSPTPMPGIVSPIAIAVDKAMGFDD